MDKITKLKAWSVGVRPCLRPAHLITEPPATPPGLNSWASPIQWPMPSYIRRFPGTQKWMVYNGRSHLEMEDNSGYPYDSGNLHTLPYLVIPCHDYFESNEFQWYKGITLSWSSHYIDQSASSLTVQHARHTLWSRYPPSSKGKRPCPEESAIPETQLFGTPKGAWSIGQELLTYLTIKNHGCHYQNLYSDV